MILLVIVIYQDLTVQIVMNSKIILMKFFKLIVIHQIITIIM